MKKMAPDINAAKTLCFETPGHPFAQPGWNPMPQTRNPSTSSVDAEMPRIVKAARVGSSRNRSIN
jgi:hypothetical protein